MHSYQGSAVSACLPEKSTPGSAPCLCFGRDFERLGLPCFVPTRLLAMVYVCRRVPGPDGDEDQAPAPWWRRMLGGSRHNAQGASASRPKHSVEALEARSRLSRA